MSRFLAQPRKNIDFYSRTASTLATELIGCIFVKQEENAVLAAQITEVEAYTGFDDPADHAYNGKTNSNASLFLDAGHLYVHSIHKYFCVDIVCDTVDVPGSVLIRSMKPLEGVGIMQSRRQKNEITELLSGPGKICQAFSIDKKLDGLAISDENSSIFIVSDPENKVFDITKSSRIGISKAKEKQLRFCMSESRFLSRWCSLV